jgi:hypothetical protein
LPTCLKAAKKTPVSGRLASRPHDNDLWRKGNDWGEGATRLNLAAQACVVKTPRRFFDLSRRSGCGDRDARIEKISLYQATKFNRQHHYVGKRNGILFDYSLFLTQVSLRTQLFFLLISERAKPLTLVNFTPRRFSSMAMFTRGSAQITLLRNTL